MNQLDLLQQYVIENKETADIDPTKMPFYHKLAADHGLKIGEFLDVYMAEAENPLKAKFVRFAQELRKLRWHSAAIDDHHMVFSRFQSVANQRAMEYKRGATEQMMGELRVNGWMKSDYSSIDLLRGHVEMATTTLKATTFEEQVKELKTLKIAVTKRGDDWNMRLNEERLGVTPGEIVSIRAKFEAYAKLLWPGNTFTHFMVKPSPKGTLYYSMGASTTGISAAVSAS